MNRKTFLKLAALIPAAVGLPRQAKAQEPPVEIDEPGVFSCSFKIDNLTTGVRERYFAPAYWSIYEMLRNESRGLPYTVKEGMYFDPQYQTHIGWVTAFPTNRQQSL